MSKLRRTPAIQRCITLICVALSAIWLIAAALTIASPVAASGVPPRFTITDVHPLGTERSIAISINNRGDVVGNAGPLANYLPYPLSPIENRGFIYADGRITFLETLGNDSSWAWGINDAGQVAGAVKSAGGKRYPHATQFTTDSAERVGTLGGDMSLAFDVNARGQMVGWAENDKIENRAFLYENGVMTNLGTFSGESSEAHAINSHGHVVGRSRTSTGALHAFLYTGGDLIDLNRRDFFYFGDFSTDAWDINDHGYIVGDRWIPFYEGNQIRRVVPDAFLLRDRDVTPLGTLGGVGSVARAINNIGQIVGEAKTDADRYHAFIYEDGVMSDLNRLINPFTGWELLSALDINERSQIVGYGIKDGIGRAFLLTPVPEPTAAILLELCGAIVTASGVRVCRARR